MWAPTVHINGTSKEALLEQAVAVCDAARALLQALVEASPNGRDFYVQGAAVVFGEATKHHDVDCDSVRLLLHQWEHRAELIANQGGRS